MKITSYVLILIVSVLYMIFLDGIGGSYLVGALVLAPLLSVVITFIGRSRITCDIKINKETAEKGEELSVNVIVARKGPCIIPFITIILEKNYCFSFIDENKKSFILGINKRARLNFMVKANHFGKAAVYIDNIYITDFLGLLKLNLAKEISAKNISASIYPNICDTNQHSPLLLELIDASNTQDGEDTNDNVSNFTSTPGYEHRDYVPGDSLKAINWKLSAKRDKLFIRKNEAVKGGKISIIIDGLLVRDAIDEKQLDSAETTIEAALAFTKLLSKTDIPLDFYFRENSIWRRFSIDEFTNIDTIKHEICNISLFDRDMRFPDFSSEPLNIGAVFCCEKDNGFELFNNYNLKATKLIAIALGDTGDWKITQKNHRFDFIKL